MRTVLKNYVLLLAALSCAGEKAPLAGDSAKAQASRADTSAIAPAPITPQPAPRTILFAGTSLTAGLGLEPDSAYPQLIQLMIDRAGLRYEVVNAGVSGETSSGLVRRLDWLLRQPLDIVVIETGANDGLRGVPVGTMKANIQQVIERIRAARPDARIVLVQMEAPPNLGRTYTQQFRDVFPDLARKNGVTLFPFLLEGVAGVRALNQADGMHPNEDGERIVALNVWKALAPMLRRSAESRPAILFAGTSLTAGYGLPPDSAYPQRIQRKIDSAGLRYRVVNAGVSGETSSGMLRRLDSLMRQPFEVVVIETGANDGWRGLSTDSTASNLEQILERARAAQPKARIALVQMEVPAVLSSGIVLGDDYVRRFRELFPAAARRRNVVLLPFLLDGVAGKPELNLPDRFHPNAAGQRVLAENAWKGLRPLLR